MRQSFTPIVLEMEAEQRVLIDPLNNEVHLPGKFNQVLLLQECIDKDLSLTVLKPAMIILSKDSKNLYHSRVVGWELTVMLKSGWENGHWKVSECLFNVDAKIVNELISNGVLLTF